MNQEQQAPVVIFGAGKIARGYLGHLLALAGRPIVFIDVNEVLVRLINERGRYTVHILGDASKSMQVTGIRAAQSADPGVAGLVAEAPAVFVSVGGPNLPAVAGPLAAGLHARREAGGRLLNIVCCENWHRPAIVLRAALAEKLTGADRDYLNTRVGIAESTVLRSCIEATPEQRAEDPLAVQAQDYWELQIDASALVEPMLPVAGLKPVPDFLGALERKLFTYNAINATVSYLGLLRGHRYLYEAAHDPMILEVAQGVISESGAVISAKHGYTREEQQAYGEQSLRKYQNRDIVDPLERQVRDPIRKLGRHDRLVGAACLALEYGIRPDNLALGIAAALQYASPQDPSAVRLQALIESGGLDAVFEQVCEIEPEGELARMVKARLPDLEKFRQPAV
jgi:mannitol-1-phosphate 5-dehydrogenase